MILLTTSLGNQSEVMLHIMSSLPADVCFVHVKRRDVELTDIQKRLADRYEVEVISCDDKRQAIQTFIQEHNITVWLTGIRKGQTEERTGDVSIVSIQFGVSKVAPIYFWTDEQVWYYCKRNGLHWEERPSDKKECGLHDLSNVS